MSAAPLVLPAGAAGAGAPVLVPPRVAPVWLLLVVLVLPLVAVALVHFALTRQDDAERSALVTLKQAERIDDASLQPPALSGAAQRLPLFEPMRGATAQRPFWLLLRFQLEQGAESTWSLALNHRTPVLVFLDGRLLANSVPVAEADLPPRNLQIGDRQLVVSVPAAWLAAGEHVLAVRVGAASASGVSMSPVLLGPVEAVADADQLRRFWFQLRLFTTLVSVVVGTLLLLVWLVDRREWLYAGSGLHVLMLALLLSPYLLQEPPLPAPWWRMLLDAADVLAKGLLPVLIAAWAAPQPDAVRRAALAYVALALPTDLLAAFHGVPWSDFSHPWPWWALAGRAAVLLLALALALRALRQQLAPDRVGTALLVGLSLWVWADLVLFALLLPGRVPVVDLNVLAYAGWALWVTVLLYRRLVDARRREARLRDELAGRLEQRTRELQAQFAALQASESARQAAAERERLLQEMHDGLGAQLTSAKMLASDGRLSSAEMVDVLDASLREMRLTVDALSVTDGDLGVLLATLRHRLEPALRAGGIVLDWRVEETPRVPVLAGTGGREFARIVQEGFSNVVHHAGASRVEVRTRLVDAGRRVRVSIADDGRGMPVQPNPGRGLRNMRQRAARVKATVQWNPVPLPGTGTELVIELPLGETAAQS